METPPLPWTAGLPVAQVSLDAPAGGLPRENLEPLLRLSQGDIYDPALVRQDIALLVRAGDFASVEVDAEPWFTIDDQGEPVSAVRVVYRVYPPPRIQRINVVGVTGAARRVVLAAHGLGRGEAFFPRRDKVPAQDRVREALVAEGWTSSSVTLLIETREDGQLSLEIQVDAGTARVLDDVVLAPSLQPWHDRVMATLRQAGMKRRHRITKQAEHDAREAVRSLLVSDGYLDPRVTLLFSQASDGRERLSLLGEPGSRTELLATGRGVPSAARVREIVGVEAGLRLSEGTVEDAAEALRSWLQTRGWYQAKVDGRVERRGDDALLILAVDRGARHRLQEIVVTGAEALDADTVTAALRQAAPATLGRDVLVDAAVPAAVRTLRELYRGRGYLNVVVTVGDVEIGAPRWRLPLRW
ncbi:MAG: hypothetical protein GXP62_21785, partial [Oligoflexia bacterium]|nr:hypothetical protein [Oligoflexia bacterium]